MIEVKDLVAIFLGYLLGFVVGFFYGLRSGKERFWRMPSASWRVRR